MLDIDNVPDKIIWNNRNLVINRKSILYSSSFNKGIISICNIIKENHQFLPSRIKTKIQAKDPLNPIVWAYICHSKGMEVIFKELSLQQQRHHRNDHMFYQTADYPRLLYHFPKMVTSHICEKNIFKHGFTKEDIQNVYLLPFTKTRDTKLITFQYKVIHNILPNQVSMFWAGIGINDTCPLCNSEKKPKIYMFYSCTETTMFWGRFTNWWYQTFNQNLIPN